MRNTRTRQNTVRTLALLGAAASLTWSSAAVGQTRYSESWTSLDTHTAAPEWFQDAKFGIYYHWGAFGTPMFGSEWYPRDMFNKSGNSAEYQHQMSTYGDPFGDWGYDKFLTGANDKSGKFTQFAPKLKSAGGAWDPDEWAQLLADSGARFAGPVAEHHDGFSHWDSKVNPWNAAVMGPKLNLVKLQAEAYRNKGLKVLLSMHHQWHFDPTGYYQWAPVPADTNLKQLYGKLPIAQEQQIWSDKLKEIIDEFMPDIIWQDNYLARIPEARLLAFLAYYYNAAIDAGTEVAATAKEGIIAPHKGQVKDYERGGPADISTPYWLTDDAVSPQSWCYVTGMSYYTDAQLIHSFVDKVSKGGNLLLNFSPMPDGSFPQRQKDILKAFGTFLKQMGTAIYNTRTWTVYGEGPTKMGGGSFTAPTAMTASDVRYTKSKDGDAVYAIFGGWPGNGKQVTLTSVTTSRFALGTGKVFLFGPTGGAAIELQATQDSSGLHVTLPATQPYTAIAYAVKISKTGVAPEPTPWLGGSSNPDGGVPATGGSGGSPDGSSAGAGGAGAGGRSGAGGGSGDASAGRGGASGTGGMGAGGASVPNSRGGATGSGGASATGGAAVNAGGTAVNAGGTASASGGNGVGGSASSSGGAAGGAGHGGSVPGGTTATQTSSSSGCSCTVQGAGRTNAGGIVLFGFVLALLIRRRRPTGRNFRTSGSEVG